MTGTESGAYVPFADAADAATVTAGDRPCKPPFPYYGSKTRVADKIVALLPAHRIYLEPYAGSAAVLLAKPRAPHEIINDRDGNVVAFYRAMREQPEALRRALELTPYSREEYALCAEPTDDPLERARRFVVRTAQSVNASGNGGSSGWALSTSRNQSRPGTFAGAVDRLDAIAERLRRVAIEQQDALALIERWAGHGDAVIYADPPYLARTRRTTGASAYRFDQADEAHHARLLALLGPASAAVVLSGYASDLYATALEGWHRVEVPISKPSANRRGQAATSGVEVLWTNREPMTTEWSAA